MSRSWSTVGEYNKSLRELACGHTSRYEPPIDHDVNSHRNYYGHFQSPEPQYMNPNDYSYMHHSPQRENEHFASASLTQSSLIDQLEARIAALEMQSHEESVTSNFLRQPEIYACPACGSLDHPVENCHILHNFRQSRENPRYEMPINCENGSHWDHNQSFEGCDQYFVNPNDHAHMYHSPQFEHEEFCTPMNLDSTTEAFRLSEQNFDRSTSRIQAYLDQILLHLQKEEIHEEMYVVPNEVSSPIHVNDVEYEPNLEEHESTNDTTTVNEDQYACYHDDDYDDYDDMLEEHENIVEPVGSITYGFSPSTFMNVVFSNTHCNSYDFDIDMGFVQLFCEDEHDIGIVESSVDTNMHENIFDVSDSLPRSHCDISPDLPMHENKFVDDVDDSDCDLANLFDDCEHVVTLVEDLGDVDVISNDVPIVLHKSQSDGLPPNLDLVCTHIVKPTFLRVPNLGLELCASQVLLDYFASKYNIFEEPQLELACLPVPSKVHFELDLVHDEPPKLRDFVSKILSVEKSRFGGSSFCFTVSLAFISCYICVKLLKPLHFVFWVDPQLFRLLVYGEFFVYNPVDKIS